MTQSRVMEISVPVPVLHRNNGTTEVINEFELTINQVGSLNRELEKDFFIKLPQQVSAHALDSFETKLHEAVPSLKNMTEDHLERLISDEDSDEFDEQ
jgi:hypothetical protein